MRRRRSLGGRRRGSGHRRDDLLAQHLLGGRGHVGEFGDDASALHATDQREVRTCDHRHVCLARAKKLLEVRCAALLRHPRTQAHDADNHGGIVDELQVHGERRAAAPDADLLPTATVPEDGVGLVSAATGTSKAVAILGERRGQTLAAALGVEALQAYEIRVVHHELPLHPGLPLLPRGRAVHAGVAHGVRDHAHRAGWCLSALLLGRGEVPHNVAHDVRVGALCCDEATDL
mmetsp:Transcript_33334/g.106253  ORF Transcript_33334/g.106253 Transcript_33334/m.106253 type:complete len:233 (-) Transcript_33334:358-1056(-)